MTRWACLAGIAAVLWFAFIIWLGRGLPDIIPEPLQLRIIAVIGLLLIMFIGVVLLFTCVSFIAGWFDEDKSP